MDRPLPRNREKYTTLSVFVHQGRRRSLGHGSGVLGIGDVLNPGPSAMLPDSPFASQRLHSNFHSGPESSRWTTTLSRNHPGFSPEPSWPSTTWVMSPMSSPRITNVSV